MRIYLHTMLVKDIDHVGGDNYRSIEAAASFDHLQRKDQSLFQSGGIDDADNCRQLSGFQRLVKGINGYFLFSRNSLQRIHAGEI